MRDCQWCATDGPIGCPVHVDRYRRNLRVALVAGLIVGTLIPIIILTIGVFR